MLLNMQTNTAEGLESEVASIVDRAQALTGRVQAGIAAVASMEARTLASECRAIEGGHQARLAGDGHHFLVKGEDHPEHTYRVGVHAVGDTVLWSCDHPVLLGHAHQPVTMRIPCRHASTAARRLEREGLLRWDGGRWVPTAKAVEVGVAKAAVEDPFQGLPGCE